MRKIKNDTRMEEFNIRKTIQALNYFAIEEGGMILKMKAIKLIWLSDRAHLRSYGHLISMDQYFARPFGVIPCEAQKIVEGGSNLYEEDLNYLEMYISIKDRYNLRSLKETDISLFTESELKVLRKVNASFSAIEILELLDIALSYPEWKKHEKEINSEINVNCMINNLDFFEDPPLNNASVFQQSEEVKRIAKEVYLTSIESRSYMD